LFRRKSPRPPGRRESPLKKLIEKLRGFGKHRGPRGTSPEIVTAPPPEGPAYGGPEEETYGPPPEEEETAGPAPPKLESKPPSPSPPSSEGAAVASVGAGISDIAETLIERARTLLKYAKQAADETRVDISLIMAYEAALLAAKGETSRRLGVTVVSDDLLAILEHLARVTDDGALSKFLEEYRDELEDVVNLTRLARTGPIRIHQGRIEYLLWVIDHLIQTLTRGGGGK